MSIFSINDGQFISKPNARLLCLNFRNSNPSHPVSQFFGKDKIDQILKQKNIIGLRIYYAQDNQPTGNTPHLVIVGVDANDEDMLDTNNGHQILQFSVPCPPTCPPPGSETL